MDLSLQIAGGPFGGERSFFKPQVRFAQYIPSLGRTFLAVNGEAEGRAIGEGQIVAEAGEISGRIKIEVLDWKKPERKRR